MPTDRAILEIVDSAMFLLRFITISVTQLIVLSFLAACAPVVNFPGQRIVEPGIRNNYFVAADGAQLPVRSWLPESMPLRAVVIGVHGFNDYSYSFAIPGSYLVRYGIGCYAYDQRGFGSAPGIGFWSGTDAYAEDLNSFVREVHKQHPDVPVYLLGESMGGAVAIVTMTGSNPPPIDGAILVAPAVWGRAVMPWYQRLLLAATSHTLPWLELTGDGLDITPSDNLDMRRSLYYDPQVIKGTRVDAMYGLTNLMDEALARSGTLTVPTLVLYGKRDNVIPKEAMLQALEKMPVTVRKAFYEQGYHLLLRDLHREKPLIDIATWITDRTKPLPYGTPVFH